MRFSGGAQDEVVVSAGTILAEDASGKFTSQSSSFAQLEKQGPGGLSKPP